MREDLGHSPVTEGVLPACLGGGVMDVFRSCAMSCNEAFHASRRINIRTCLRYTSSRVGRVRFSCRLIEELAQFASPIGTKHTGSSTNSTLAIT